MYSLVLKNAKDEITLSMLESRICTKVALDESTVKLKFSYIPLLVGSEEQFSIFDGDYLCVSTFH